MKPSDSTTPPHIGRPFTISRVFDAPRALVWQAWTDPEHLKRWFGPKGFTMPKCTMDFRPGGTFHYCMQGPGGAEMWGKWIFREITPPAKLVLINAFSDAAGNLTRHPMAPAWPLESLSTTTLTETDGKTTLTIESAPYNATAEENKLFDSAHDSMRGGWGGTFEQLAEYLKTVQA